MLPLARQHIAVGVIYNASGDKVLVTKRPLTAHMGGLWEFPGGKIRDHETVLTALKRELYEELNLEVESAHPFIQIKHDYPDKKIKLDVWMVDSWRGDIYGKEGQELEWRFTTQLRRNEFPAADTEIIKAVALSHLYLITPNLDSYDDVFLDKAKRLIENGVKLFQFRSKNTPYDAHEKTVKKLIDICNENKCLFIYNGPPEKAIRLHAHGVHLNSDDLLQRNKRPLSEQYWVAASCHKMMEINHAVDIGVDFCVLSAIHKTASHKNNEAMGWKKFEDIALNSKIPVYALGGIQPADLDIALSHGAQGIAMISGVWNARNPVMAVQQCLERY